MRYDDDDDDTRDRLMLFSVYFVNVNMGLSCLTFARNKQMFTYFLVTCINARTLIYLMLFQVAVRSQLSRARAKSHVNIAQPWSTVPVDQWPMAASIPVTT